MVKGKYDLISVWHGTRNDVSGWYITENALISVWYNTGNDVISVWYNRINAV